MACVPLTPPIVQAFPQFDFLARAADDGSGLTADQVTEFREAVGDAHCGGEGCPEPQPNCYPPPPLPVLQRRIL